MSDSSNSKKGSTRREVLGWGALAALAACAPACGRDSNTLDTGGDSAEGWTREPVPDAWVSGVEEDSEAFPLGVQAGDPASAGAVCWTKYTGAEDLRLQVWGWDGASWTLSLEQSCSIEEGGYVQSPVEGLLEDTFFCFVFFDSEGAYSAVGRFRTPPESGLPVVVFGGISCTSQRYQPFPALSHGAKEVVDFVFLCGDQVYNDDVEDLEGKRGEWASNLSSRGYRDVLSSAAIVSVWDDHEIEDEWGRSPVSEESVEAGKRAFHEHTPTRRAMGEPLYRSLRWADTLEIFVLDCRSERQPEQGIYLSQEQMDWFANAIQSSTAHFKLILNSVPFANFNVLFGNVEIEDRWDGYPEARAQLLAYLEGIENVYFISGDFHMGLVCHVEAEGFGWDIYDILVGPGGQSVNPAAALMEPDPQFPVGVSKRNFTRLVANPHSNRLTVEYIGEDGEMLASIVLPEDQ